MAKVQKNQMNRDRPLASEDGWMDTPVNSSRAHSLFRQAEKLEVLGLPIPEMSPTDEDWKLPSNWKEIILEGLGKGSTSSVPCGSSWIYCVRCGACADKCHFYLGSGDPKNMPVLRAELLRSVYRKDFTWRANMGKIAGAVNSR